MYIACHRHVVWGIALVTRRKIPLLGRESSKWKSEVVTCSFEGGCNLSTQAKAEGAHQLLCDVAGSGHALGLKFIIMHSKAGKHAMRAAESAHIRTPCRLFQAFPEIYVWGSRGDMQRVSVYPSMGSMNAPEVAGLDDLPGPSSSQGATTAGACVCSA